MPDKLTVVFTICIALTAVTTIVAVASITLQKQSDRDHAASAQQDQMLAAIHAVDQSVNKTLENMRIFTYMNREWVIEYVKDKPHLLQNRSTFFSEWNSTLFELWAPMTGSSGVQPEGWGFNAQFLNGNGEPIPLTWQSSTERLYNGTARDATCGSENNDENCYAHATLRGADERPVYVPDLQYITPQPMTWTNLRSFYETLLPWPASDGSSYFFLTHQSDFLLNGRHVNMQTYGLIDEWQVLMSSGLRASQECVIFDSNKYVVSAHLDDPSYAQDLDTCFQTYSVNFTTDVECLLRTGDTHKNRAIRALFAEAFPAPEQLEGVLNLTLEYRSIGGVEKLFAVKTLVNSQHLILHVVCQENDVRASPFEATKTSLALGVPMGILIVAMVCVAGYLNRERQRRQQQDAEAVELTTNISAAMCEYDLEFVDMVLDAYSAKQDHKVELVQPLRDLRKNLGEYRPYLPRYMLPEVGRLTLEASRSVADADSDGSSIGSRDSIDCGHNTTRLNKSVRSMHAPLQSDIARRIVLAAVDFVGSTYCRYGPKSKLNSSTSIDVAAIAVHNALAATNGVLHYFVGDCVVASWNSAKPALQPEKKACHFICSLRGDAALKYLQMTGGVASGEAMCHTGGDTKQRTLVVCAPSAFAQLDAARRLAQDSGSVIVHSSVRASTKMDFKMVPYTVHEGAVYYEVVKDLSDDDSRDEEWMYRVAKTENTTDAQLEQAAQHWLAGRLELAHKTLEAIVTEDPDVITRLSAIAARIA